MPMKLISYEVTQGSRENSIFPHRTSCWWPQYSGNPACIQMLPMTGRRSPAVSPQSIMDLQVRTMQSRSQELVRFCTLGLRSDTGQLAWMADLKPQDRSQNGPWWRTRQRANLHSSHVVSKLQACACKWGITHCHYCQYYTNRLHKPSPCIVMSRLKSCVATKQSNCKCWILCLEYIFWLFKKPEGPCNCINSLLT